MRKPLSLLLAMCLLSSPALPLMAEEGADVPAKVEESQPAPPTLPSVQAPATDVPEDVSATAKPEVPDEVLAKPGEAKPEEQPSRFKLRNFVLGFLGGALLGGAAGVLVSGGKEDNSMATNALLYGGAGGLGLGLASLFLGATTPEEAKPPKVDEGALRPGWPGVQVALRF